MLAKAVMASHRLSSLSLPTVSHVWLGLAFDGTLVLGMKRLCLCHMCYCSLGQGNCFLSQMTLYTQSYLLMYIRSWYLSNLLVVSSMTNPANPNAQSCSHLIHMMATNIKFWTNRSGNGHEHLIHYGDFMSCWWKYGIRHWGILVSMNCILTNLQFFLTNINKQNETVPYVHFHTTNKQNNMFITKFPPFSLKGRKELLSITNGNN